jgi:hypothetical protein
VHSQRRLCDLYARAYLKRLTRVQSYLDCEAADKEFPTVIPASVRRRVPANCDTGTYAILKASTRFAELRCERLECDFRIFGDDR